MEGFPTGCARKVRLGEADGGSVHLLSLVAVYHCWRRSVDNHDSGRDRARRVWVRHTFAVTLDVRVQRQQSVTDPQPWLIGVKGVLDIDKAAIHLYGGGIRGRYRRLDYTPSGSEFAVPEQDLFRNGSGVQYDRALEAAHGPQVGRMYMLIDTRSSTIYYFSADRPPTVCLFTGREGGLGRFVLCSERCGVDELHKETVLRMPTYVSQRMELCDWVAIG